MTPETPVTPEITRGVSEGLRAVGRLALARQTASLPEAAKPGQPETPAQANRRRMDTVRMLADSNSFPEQQFRGESGKLEGSGDKPVTIVLDSASNPQGGGIDQFSQRTGTITHIVSIGPDTVVCRVVVKAEGTMSGTGAEGIEMTLSRSAVAGAQIRAEQESVDSALASMTEGPAKVALKMYLEGMAQGKKPDEQSRQQIVEAARAMHLPLVDDIVTNLEKQMKPEEPADPQKEYQNELAKWEEKKNAAADPNEFAEPQPQPPDQDTITKYQTDRVKYEAAQTVYLEKMQAVKALFGDEIVASPKALSTLFGGQLREQNLLQTESEAANSEVERISAEIDRYKKAEQTGKIDKVVENPQTGKPITIDEVIDKGQAENQRKLLEAELPFAQAEAEKIAKLAETETVEQRMETAFNALYDGSLREEDANLIGDGLNQGDFGPMLGYLKRELENEKAEITDENRNAKAQKIAKLEHKLEIISKLKGARNIVGIGLAALLVVTIMQGMSGGGGHAG